MDFDRGDRIMGGGIEGMQLGSEKGNEIRAGTVTVIRSPVYAGRERVVLVEEGGKNGCGEGPPD